MSAPGAFDEALGRAHATLDAVLAGVHEEGAVRSAGETRVVVDPAAEMEAHYAELQSRLGSVVDVASLGRLLVRQLVLDGSAVRAESRRLAQLFGVHLSVLQRNALLFFARVLACIDRPSLLVRSAAPGLCAALPRPELLDEVCVAVSAVADACPECCVCVLRDKAALHAHLEAVCARISAARPAEDSAPRIRLEAKRARKTHEPAVAPSADCRPQLRLVAAAMRVPALQALLSCAQRRALLSALLANADDAPGLRVDAAASLVLGAQPAYMPADDEVALLVSALRHVLAYASGSDAQRARVAARELDVLLRPRRVGLRPAVEAPAAYVPAPAPVAVPASLHVVSAFDMAAAVPPAPERTPLRAAAEPMRVAPVPPAAPARALSDSDDSLPDIVS